ncbi:DinB family protein [Reticulomyxa filosa]|uniref:DinB family protein n=1 Tax=Reticulomyxa filosa TaxID=46433 RepID=X6MCE2_RETFI|nr:DinB family protein [Reticulomyxa filosa]|eukprot:ETO11326.1 DinB family protein [Reticulomyxa filosa]
MSLKKHLLFMARYNIWASQEIRRFVKTHEKKYPKILDTPVSGLPFSTVRNVLAHIWAADQVWYSRMKNLSEVQTKDGSIRLSTKELYTYWVDNHENEGKYGDIFKNEDSDKIFTALQESGQAWIDIIETQFKTDEEIIQKEFSYFSTGGVSHKSFFYEVFGSVVPFFFFNKKLKIKRKCTNNNNNKIEVKYQ